MIKHREDSIQEIRRKEAEKAAIEQQVTDLQLALVEQYESNLGLQDELTYTQLALVEVYETMNGGAANG